MNFMEANTNITRAQYHQLVDERILEISNIKINIFTFLKVIRQMIIYLCNTYKIATELAYSHKVMVTINDQFTSVIQMQQQMIVDLQDRIEKLEGKNK